MGWCNGNHTDRRTRLDYHALFHAILKKLHIYYIAVRLFSIVVVVELVCLVALVVLAVLRPSIAGMKEACIQTSTQKAIALMIHLNRSLRLHAHGNPYQATILWEYLSRFLPAVVTFSACVRVFPSRDACILFLSLSASSRWHRRVGASKVCTGTLVED